MAEYVVSGGGNALNTALNTINLQNNDTILVEPGVYSRVRFNSRYQTGLKIKSTEGREKTIIDAEGLSSCFYSFNNNSSSRLSVYGFTFRNANFEIEDTNETSVLNRLGHHGVASYGYNDLIDCGIYDISCNIYGPFKGYNGYWNRLWILFNTRLYNCEVSGNYMNCCFSSGASSIRHSDIHHNYFYRHQQGDIGLFRNPVYNSKIHDNYLSSMCFVTTLSINNAIYRNHGSPNISNKFPDGTTHYGIWFAERGICKNNTFVKNDGIGYYQSTWGGKAFYKNNLFYDNYTADLSVKIKPTGEFGFTGTSIFINNYLDQPLSSLQYYNYIESRNSCLVSGNIFLPNSDPGFVDEENDDYRLRSDSFLISAGTGYDMSNYEKLLSGDANKLRGLENNLYHDIDIEGKQYDSEHPSIGAYQYQDDGSIPSKIEPIG